MRMPGINDLDRDQNKVFSGAPLDEHILVIGPPGTGKTVIAVHRAIRLKNTQDSNVNLIMYNRVLQRFVENSENLSEAIECKTMHGWVMSWWKGICGPKWQPKKAGRYEYDWIWMAQFLSNGIDEKRAHRINWGNLIVDEGQDFSNEMYTALNAISYLVKDQGIRQPTITVFGDENQRLNPDKNSTTKQIRTALAIPKDREFHLTKNYRNSLPIANFAQHFEVTRTGNADLPTKQGPQPIVCITKQFELFIKFIETVLSTRKNIDIGIITPDDKTRTKYYKALEKGFSEREDILIQTYSSKNSEGSEELVFGKEGTITILNKASCKGLEFDAVFIAGLERVSVSGANLDTFKMDMYVMCSRAREMLFLLFDIGEGELPECFPYLPSSQKNLCSYRSIDKQIDINDMLKKVEWKQSDKEGKHG